MGLLSTSTVTAVGLSCKALLNIGFASITVNGLPILLDALENDAKRNSGQGVVTGGSFVPPEFVKSPVIPPVSNHIST